jgi:hypothetical protein
MPIHDGSDAAVSRQGEERLQRSCDVDFLARGSRISVLVIPALSVNRAGQRSPRLLRIDERLRRLVPT